MKKYVFTLLVAVLGLSVSNAQSHFNNFEDNQDLSVIIDSNTDSLWEIGTPSKDFFDSAYSNPFAILTDTFNTYPINSSSSFQVILNESITWSYPYIQLEWFQKTDMEEGVDGGIIEASYDSGQTWLNVFSDSTFAPAMVGGTPTDTLFNGEVGITGTSDWTWIAICWGTWTGDLPVASDSILVRFTFVSDSIETDQAGWMIDNFYSQTNIFGSTENQEILPISIFPNPVKNALSFRLNATDMGEGEIEVYNTNGQKVLAERISVFPDEINRINTKQLSVGSYSLKVTLGDKIYGGKFLKME